jgi:hypothetical protein
MSNNYVCLYGQDLAMRRTKRILKYRKQDSYTRAIGGSFEVSILLTSINPNPHGYGI